MTALGWTCAVLGFSIFAALLLGRMLDLADRGTTTADRDDWSPFDAVPLPARPVNGWTAEVSADYLSDDDPELHRRYFAIVEAERVWFL